ncbi:MAG: FHA domain-containing protein [Akkermansia sp.]|nr:FHA domain-containing protein [Akkermansia sp.]
MEYTPRESCATLAAQERRVRDLEEELAQCRAAVNMLRAELVSSEAGVPLPEQEKNANPDFHYLAPLNATGHLSRKWKLGSGLTCTEEASAPTEEQELLPPAEQERSLRLYGLLSTGNPWQVNIPFSRMANYGGCVIGRCEESADIVLAEPGISRCHARLELTDDGLVVTDENSTNGVWVNDTRLSAYNRQMPLDDGAMLTLGNIILRAEYN